MPRILVFFAILFTLSPAISKAAQYHYTYNDNCNKAYHQCLAMNFEEGRATLIKELMADPYNLMATYLADYEDFIVLMLNSDAKEYAERKHNMDSRLALLEKGDEKSPWFKFCRAGIYLHWTIVHLRFGEYYSAASMFKKSYSLLKENQKLFPDFEYNLTFAGIEESVVGSLPNNYKWIASVFGMSGSIKEGMDKLGQFLKTHTDNQPLRRETQFYYVYTGFYFSSKQKEIWNYVNGPDFADNSNLLNAVVKTFVGLDYNKSDEVLKVIREAQNNKNFGNYPYLQYQHGMALLTALDSGCVRYFNEFLKRNKSELHIKDAWQKLAYYYWMTDRRDKAEACRAHIAEGGSTQTDVDRQAMRFADNGVWPNPKLLQARMLLEGGYYTRAFEVLAAMGKGEHLADADKAEYYYRLGRVYEESGEHDKAIEYYRYAVKAGTGRKEQYAARAALHIGKVYEALGQKAKAESAYEEALSLPDHDFQNSIDMQAKAGLNRLKG